MVQDLTQGDIKTNLKSLAIPAATGFLFHTLYNVTDTYFAGSISTQSLAALAVSFPIFFLLLAISHGMSSAVNTIVSNSLGSTDSKQETANIAKNALVFAFLLAIIITAIGLSSTSTLMSVLGAKGEYLDTSLAYINIVVAGSIIFVGTIFMNSLLSAQGDMVSFRNILVITFFLNIFLDYLFIELGFGIQGIAYATVITESVALAYLSYRLYKTQLLQGLFSFHFKAWKKLFFQGIPPTTNMFFMALGTFIVTYYASDFGEHVIAAFGVGMKIEQLALMPIIGINVAVLTMVAQNNGAKEYERIEKTLKIALEYSLYISFCTIILLWLFPEYLLGFFTQDAEVIAEGIIYLHIEAFLVFPFAMIFIYVALLQGIEKPKFIFYLSLTRQIILPAILLQSISLWTDNIVYVWLAIAFNVVIAALAVRFYARRKLDAIKAQSATSSPLSV